MLDRSLGSEDVHTLPQWKAELDYEIQITYEQSCLHSRRRDLDRTIRAVAEDQESG